ncbi:MAG: hypothetical protein QXT03_05685 [Desulfurococcaceae archaeon]
MVKLDQPIDLDYSFLDKLFPRSVDWLNKLSTGGGSRLSQYYLYRRNVHAVDWGEMGVDELLSLLMNVGLGYVVYYGFTNHFGITRSVLGEYYLTNFCRESCDKNAYLYLPLFLPTRLQLMYFLINHARSEDPETTTHSLRSMLFTGSLLSIQNLALKIYLELEETYYLQKYSREKTLITPTDFTLLVARKINDDIYFSDFEKAVTYLYRKNKLYPPLYLHEHFKNKEPPDEIEDLRVDEKIISVVRILEKHFRDLNYLFVTTTLF